ncbi:DUF6036 family nucleotidyltransferase [Micrococcus flavus]|uniref:Nucleotidyl transferase n=1 Tax=Micrococcus flavus TaxID=384602 RepID=A0A7W7PBB5_9MICC|nr:DUF6036 family nucleotidyltransferase [Micrococcus flavus]MBB4882828.1 hypothetical protein [Micrococcus flavus]GGK40440.1 hypothetical protein GCM10007073_04040 [Micrococcus flavus]
MNQHGAVLDATHVRALFQELSDRLGAAGVHAQLFVVGGAAMALAYDQGRLTRDVDALFIPAPEVREAAEMIGASHGLEPDWLNDAAKGFLPGQDEHPVTVFESESLLVQVASPEYLLAMKLHASRDERDLDDAATLFLRLGYTTAEQGIELLTSTYPTGRLLPRHRYIVEDVAQRSVARRAEQKSAPQKTDRRPPQQSTERRSKLPPSEAFGRGSGRPRGPQPPTLGP